MHRGYFKIWRKIEDSGLYQMPNTLALFMFLLSKAMHKDCKVGTPLGVVELKRGQYISGRKQLGADLKQSEREIRTSLSRLIELQIIDQQTTSKYSVYTIVNYSKYQDADQQTTSTQTNKRPANDQQTTTKEECNNVKNVNSISSSKGTRLPIDSILTAGWGNLALEIRPDWANDDVRVEYEAFKDYWIAKAGKDGVKLDWLATWRNWCRNSRRKGSLNAG